MKVGMSLNKETKPNHIVSGWFPKCESRLPSIPRYVTICAMKIHTEKTNKQYKWNDSCSGRTFENIGSEIGY